MSDPETYVIEPAFVPLFDDHLACPALRRWLPPMMDGANVHTEIDDDGGRFRPPREIRQLLAGPHPGGGTRHLVIAAAPLDKPPALQWFVQAPVGSRVVELASARRRGLSSLWPPARREKAQRAAADRVAVWLRYGMLEVEQWVTLVPIDTVVTMAIRGPGVAALVGAQERG